MKTLIVMSRTIVQGTQFAKTDNVKAPLGIATTDFGATAKNNAIRRWRSVPPANRAVIRIRVAMNTTRLVMILIQTALPMMMTMYPKNSPQTKVPQAVVVAVEFRAKKW